MIDHDKTPFYVPAICCQEILQGAKNQREWDSIYGNLSTQRIIVPENPWETHVAAARIFFDCRRKGLTVRSPADCFIAQLTLENDATLISDDADFDRIAEIRPLKVLK
jgi:predicted nucleic acid-binding protein